MGYGRDRNVRNFQERKANQEWWVEWDGAKFPVVRAWRWGNKGGCFDPWALEPQRIVQRSWKKHRRTRWK